MAVHDTQKASTVISPQPVTAVMQSLVDPASQNGHHAVMPTGFGPLDQELGGGLRSGNLALLGGLPGVGKTIAALQWARTLASDGATVSYACYEHEERELLGRLLSLEIAGLAHPDNMPAVDKMQHAISEVTDGRASLADLLSREPLVRSAYEAVSEYAGRLWLLRASGRHTGVAELEKLVADVSGPTVLVVDYLQKVALRIDTPNEAEKVTRVAEDLKEVALSRDVAVLAVVAANRAGMEARRLRLHHLRGSTALAYESDVVVLLNDKTQAVSKVHLAYDPVRAETFRDQVVFTVEKNRNGRAPVDMEFRKDFANFRFDPQGSYVTERLVDERFDTE